MATTPNDIFTAAYAKSRKNNPGVTATPAELLNLFVRVYPLFWTIAARINPAFFGKQDPVLFDGLTTMGWPRPTDAESIFRIEDSTGEEVIVVPFDERDADPYVPAVYEWGQVFYSAGNSLDPDEESGVTELTFWYSKIPDAVVSATEELEALWPEHFNELLVLELAIVLSLKDDRNAEVGLLRQDRDAWLQRYIAFLEHATAAVVRSTGHTQRFQHPGYASLAPLLAGGTEVQV